MKPISKLITNMKPSGIREFFVYTTEKPEVLQVNAISVVGSFNNWDASTNCAEFTKMDEGYWRLNELHLSPGETFKIVVNHTWEIHGDYGYNYIQGINDYGKLLTSQGAEGNIKVNAACVIILEALVDGNNVNILLEDARQE